MNSLLPIHIGLALLTLPAALSCGYLLLLTLLSGRPPRPPRPSRRLRFDIIVPAHNEAEVICATLDSLAGLDWPEENFRRIVVADNCDDATAAVARAAGAVVLERHDPQHRGKGYALAHAFAHCQNLGWADALVVVDADTLVSKNLLEAFAARIERGDQVVQAYYGVRNPQDSWRTRLMTIAHGAFHVLRSSARERLHLSTGLRGNGWCLTLRTLRAVPYGAYSLAEDLEYGIALGRAGYRIAYAHEASADAQMESDAAIAGRQRQRWEGGRMALARREALPLLALGLSRLNATCADLAVDLLVLPLSWIALNVALLIGVTLLASWLQPLLLPWLWIAAACGLTLLLYVLRGWQLSGIGLRGARDLLQVPRFLLWKLRLLRFGASQEWVPTRRKTP